MSMIVLKESPCVHRVRSVDPVTFSRCRSDYVFNAIAEHTYYYNRSLNPQRFPTDFWNAKTLSIQNLERLYFILFFVHNQKYSWVSAEQKWGKFDTRFIVN